MPVITGTSGNDTLQGTSDNDRIEGLEGDDILNDSGGADTLDGGSGADTLTGGVGDDVYVVDSSGDVVIEDTGAGTDTVQTTLSSYSIASLSNVDNLTFTGVGGFTGEGNSLPNTILGNIGNDSLTGGAGNDRLTGSSGDDTLDGGSGADTMFGGSGSDTYYVDNAGDSVSETAFNSDVDVVLTTIDYTLSGVGAALIENMAYVGAGNFQGVGNGQANVITGGAGNDTLEGSSGLDTLVGGAGDDVYVVDFSTSTFDSAPDAVTENADQGIDTVRTARSSYSLGDNVENLVFFGSGNFIGGGNVLANQITGGSGADVLDGGAGVDTLTGGLGDDSYVDNENVDSFVEQAGQGNDTVRTALSSYTLHSANIEDLRFIGTGAFYGVGDANANHITGGVGNDTLDGGGGADTLTGGEGDDTYIINYTGAFIDETSWPEIDTVATSLSTYSLSIHANVENLTYTGAGNFSGSGNSKDNVLRGGDGSDTLDGGGGDDTLYGGSGGDRLLGGSNNDTLDGGTGADTLLGGDGNDTYIVDSLSDVVTEGVGLGADEIRTAFNTYTLASIANLENLAFTGAGDFGGTGNALANKLTGGSGNDILDGSTGADTLIGGAGNDTFIVDNAGDVVTEALDEGTDEVRTTLLNYTLGANLENLTYTGGGNFFGSGNLLTNIIHGGSGNDTLWAGGPTSDTVYGGFGNDTMQDFGGAPTFVGGAGNDWYIVQYAATIVEEANEGVDRVESRIDSFTLDANVENLIYAGVGNFTGIGNGLDNDITGNAGADTLSGGAGSDTLNGAAGADSLSGGAGDDIYIVDSAGDQVVELNGDGTDTVRTTLSSYTLASVANVENVTFTGSSGSFTVVGNALVNTLTGGAGNDTLDGGAGADSLTGGGGNDTYFVDDAGDVVTEQSNAGDDTIRTSLSSFSLASSNNIENLSFSGAGSFNATGNSLSNSIVGASGGDVLSGGAGNDTLDGAAGDDSLTGGTGNDTFLVDSLADQIIEDAGAGNDTIRTTLSSFSLASMSNVENLTFTGVGAFAGDGNSASNQIAGGAGADTINGGAGDDTLRGAGGNDSLTGGEDFDTGVFSGAFANYTISDLGNGAYSVTDLRGGAPDGTDTLTGVESLQFADGTYSLSGDAKMPQALVGPLSWLTAGSVTNSNWANFDEIDAYRVVLQAGYTYTFSLTDTSGGRDTYLSLYNANNLSVPVASNDDINYPFNVNSSFTYTATSSGEFYLAAEELYGNTGSYSLTYRNLTGSDSILSNASTNRTIAIGGSSQTEWVEIAGDHDWYRVTLTAGQSYAFSLTGSGGAALTDPFLALRDSSGALVSFDDDGGSGANSLLRFTATSSGTYYLDVSAYAQETGEYTLSAATGPAQDPLDTLDLGFTINHTNISVYFATSGQNFSSSFTGSQSATRAWTTTEINAAFAAFNTISAATNLTFTQVGSSAGADFIMSLTNLTGALGQAFTSGGAQALIEFDTDGTGWATGLQSGGYGFITLVHEIGHALGLDHPHYDGGDNQIMQGVLDSFYSYGTFQLDQGVYTTMGYNDGWPTGPLGLSSTPNYGWQSGPMALDIAALQQAYGANAATNSTDTTYTLASLNTTGTSYQAIWDSGGTDTIAYSGAANAVIDLRAATLQNAVGGGGYVSYVAGVIGGYTIANGAVIENASGGIGADYLIGNSAANNLSGGVGADRLNGGTGLNTLSGGDGVDTIDYSWTSLGARIDFGAGSNQGQSIGGGGEAFTDQLSGIERALGGAGADTFVVRSVTPGTVLGFYANSGIDTADFSYFTSAIWIDLSYQTNDAWTRDTAALTSGTWRAIVDLENVEAIVGTVYDDYVAGDAQDNTYLYNGGVDTVDLRGGIDTVDFSTFTSAVWVDLTYGDNDAWTRDAANLGSGTWRAIATLSNVESLIGTVYSDALYGNAGTRSLSGSGGNDSLYVRGVQSGVVAAFDGGTGIDALDFSGFSAAVWVHLDYSGADAWTRDNAGLTSGTWRAIGDVSGIENLTGSAYNDDLAGNANNNTFQYTGGLDLIDGQGGVDIVDFSRFNAAVWVDLAYAGVEAWTRDGQTVTAGAWRAIADLSNVEGASGTQWSDLLAGNSGANVLIGGAGADEIEGRDGGDLLDGGDDVDTLKYTLSAAAVTINLTTNSASGGDATGDTISNFENVTGSAGNDSLTGSAYDNILDGGFGADTLTGGAGNDTYIVDNANDVLVEALGEGRDLVRATAASYTLASNVENYERIGTAAYTVTGNGLDNTFFMSAITNGQLATLNGGAQGALGDTVDFSTFGAAVWVDLTYGGTPAEAWTRDSAGLTTGTYRGIADLTGIENIIGTLGDDFLRGDSADNVISYYGYGGAFNGSVGLGGRDYIDGGAGNDTADFSRINTGGIWIDLTYVGPEAWQQDFYGTWRVLADLESIENLRGSDFNDTLRGNAGNNIINGLGGNDLMTGGGGADAFVVGNANFNVPGVLGQNDTITDFTVGVDDIWLTLVNFSAFGSPGVVSANHFVIGAAAVDNDDWLIYDSSTGALFYDEDGNGATSAIQFATLTFNLSLTALSNSDFLIV